MPRACVVSFYFVRFLFLLWVRSFFFSSVAQKTQGRLVGGDDNNYCLGVRTIDRRSRIRRAKITAISFISCWNAAFITRHDRNGQRFHSFERKRTRQEAYIQNFAFNTRCTLCRSRERWSSRPSCRRERDFYDGIVSTGCAFDVVEWPAIREMSASRLNRNIFIDRAPKAQ